MPSTNATDPNFFILYVDDPVSSSGLYAELLGKPPIESAPTFVMFALDSGVRLGLWSRHTVEPSATPVGGVELAFAVDGPESVDARHAAWRDRGLKVIQAPVEMDFGYTFVALDPDGHRLRVFAPRVE